MKFDITRAWKDESYRQNLSHEDMSFLPMNPIGDVELTDTELELVFGGGGGGGGITPPPTVGGGGGHACVTNSCGGYQFSHNESMAVICEINIYSISILGNIALLGDVVQTCIKG